MKERLKMFEIHRKRAKSGSRQMPANLALSVALPLLASLMMLDQAFAQNGEMVGTAIVDERDVQLWSDGTWVFADEVAAREGCENVVPQLWFCGLGDGWTGLAHADPSLDAQFTSDDNFSVAIKALASQASQNYETTALLDILVNSMAQLSDDKTAKRYENGATEFEGDPLDIAYFDLTLDGALLPYAISLPKINGRHVMVASFALEERLRDGLTAKHIEILSRLTYE